MSTWLKSFRDFWSGIVPTRREALSEADGIVLPPRERAPVEVPKSASLEEQEFVQMLLDRWHQDMTGGNQAHERYDEYLSRWRRQHRLPDRADYRNNLSSGREFANIETQVALILGSMPRPEVVPDEDPQLTFLSPIWQAMLDDWCRRNDWDATAERAVRILLLNGEVTAKVTWDPTLSGGLGDAKIVILDPRNVAVDCEAVSWEDRKRLEEIEAFTPEELLLAFGDRARGLTSVTGTDLGVGQSAEAAGAAALERIQVVRSWYVDLSTETVEVVVTAMVVNEQGEVQAQTTMTAGQEAEPESPEAPPTEFEDAVDDEPDILEGAVPVGGAEDEELPVAPARKYPTGRVTVFTPDGKLLYDGPNPYPWWPHVRAHNYPDPHMAGGLSEMDLTRSLQDCADNFLSNVADHMDQVGNPKLVCPTNTGIGRHFRMTGAPGELLTPNPGTGSEIRYLDPPQVQGWVREFPGTMDGYMNLATGVQDVLQGQRPSGLETFATLQGLRESALTRVRKKTTRYDRFVAQLFERVIYLMQTRYHTARKIRVAGESAERLMSLAQDPAYQQQVQQQSQFPDQSAVSANPDEVLKYLGQAGKEFYFQVIATGLHGAMRVNIERGSLLSLTQSEIAAQAVELRKMGDLDRRGLLEAIRYPNRESVLQRMEAAEQAAMQAQAGAQPQPQQPADQAPGFQGAPGPADGMAQAEQPELRDYGPLDADSENVLLARGVFLPVHPEDGPEHLESHYVAAQQTPDENRQPFLDHIERHTGGVQ